MAAAGLWVRRKGRGPRVHQPRHRRDRLGELVQVDGCEHHWFEDRGPACALLASVDPPVPLRGPEGSLPPAG